MNTSVRFVLREANDRLSESALMRHEKNFDPKKTAEMARKLASSAVKLREFGLPTCDQVGNDLELELELLVFTALSQK